MTSRMVKIFVPPEGDIEVYHTDNTDDPDVSLDEMKSWISDTLSNKGSDLDFDALCRMAIEEHGKKNITKFTVAVEDMNKEGTIMISGDYDDILYIP